MATLGHRVGSSRTRVAPSGRRVPSSRGSDGDARRDTSSLASLTPRLACASPPESAPRRRLDSLRSSARPLVSPRPSIRSVLFVASCASRPTVTPLRESFNPSCAALGATLPASAERGVNFDKKISAAVFSFSFKNFPHNFLERSGLSL